MILTHVYRKIEEIPNIDTYHLETATVSSDDLMKSILRVKTDHGNEYGIRLEDPSQIMENGTTFQLGDHELLVLNVLADEAIVITPKDINEMGVIAHLLGNLHKPIQVQNGQITLLFDKVVVLTLDKHRVNYEIKKVTLDQPMRYADLTNGK
ncbi:urease accessory protein UreE [Limosilactobacillus equigenerosi]|uniref:Urease accessory protein UreE n=1 Tax=Limosilactobacillus equigenerosi DSM 18793 = JCM 14505 TaxID=1423742 RepID=A0A0R1USU9_9LACO|nr:urease accessory protein UreE [Limosilactobacillus equigenerosi]KRL93019.1 hypothetical protein FC21_GL000120 [Limosilactobacillus equigenerosi DSM 18793 = JCM 14505]